MPLGAADPSTTRARRGERGPCLPSAGSAHLQGARCSVQQGRGLCDRPVGETRHTQARLVLGNTFKLADGFKPDAAMVQACLPSVTELTCQPQHAALAITLLPQLVKLTVQASANVALPKLSRIPGAMAQCSRLTHLDFGMKGVTPSHMQTLAQLPNLQHVRVMHLPAALTGEPVTKGALGACSRCWSCLAMCTTV
jgi:hypothetical protein